MSRKGEREAANASDRKGQAKISHPTGRSPRVSGSRWFAIPVLVVAVVVCYANSLAGPFIYDDKPAISDNPTIRQLWPIGKPLCPPGHAVTVSGRPVLNLSLALNYAASGYDVRGYHLTNLAIHLAAALLLFGIVRRTASRFPAPQPRLTVGPAATSIALAVALLWAVHPLQTESVTYVVQRAESLMGLFYLLTLYCFLRGASAERAIFWYAGSVLAALLGMATKEVMVSVPLVVLLYDRTFLAGSFRACWRRRWGYYLPLAATWLLLAWLVAGTGLLATSYGTLANNVYVFTPWTYLATEPGVIVHYLRQAFWPSGLCLDYGWPAVATVGGILFPAIPLVGLLGLTAWALVKQPVWGFLGAWFFLILAPTSSFLPVQGSAAVEHRMYLPLAAVAAVVVLGVSAVCQALHLSERWRPAVLGCLLGGVGLVLAILTWQRNNDYRDEFLLWQDAVSRRPNNPTAQTNLGKALADRGQVDEAIAHFLKALEIQPDLPPAHNNLGILLAGQGKVDEAIAHFQAALETMPDFVPAHNNLGVVLAGRGRVDEAIAHFQAALESMPNYVEAHNNLGVALVGRGRVDEAIAHFQAALESMPNYQEARFNLAAALASRGRVDEAIEQFQKVLEWASARNDRVLADDIRARIRLLQPGATAGKAP